MKQLPVIGTVTDAYAFVWENRQDFLLLAFLPIVIGALVETLLVGVFAPSVDTPTDPETPPSGGPGAAVLASAMVGVVLYVMFAVAWHRLFLAQEQTTVGAALRWGARQMRFLVRLVVLAFVMVAAAFALGGPIVAGAAATTGSGPGPLRFLALVAVVIGIFLVYARLLLIFPAAALDEAMSMRDSWRLTRGNSWRMVGISFLPLFPVWIASAFVSVPIRAVLAMLEWQNSLTAILAVSLIEQAFVFAGVAVTVSALSIAYRDLKAHVSGATSLTTSE